MKKFNQLLAISGASMTAGLGTLGIGEYQDHMYRQDRNECYENLAGKPELKACLSDYDKETQDSVQATYGIIVIGLGAISLFMGGKAYQENRAQVRREEEYREAEGLV